MMEYTDLSNVIPVSLAAEPGYDAYTIGCYNGWRRFKRNPLIHTSYGEFSDPCVIRVGETYYMYVTWCDQYKITCFLSSNGRDWSAPMMDIMTSFSPRVNYGWEQRVEKPCALYRNGCFQMWYAAASFEKEPYEPGRTVIAYAHSRDGLLWERWNTPVLEPELLWEGNNVSYPCVLFDEDAGVYRMWYGGGDYEYPQFVGYAESADGTTWERKSSRPVFSADRARFIERDRITPGQVFRNNGKYYMLYSAYEHITNARLCLAESVDGLSWTRRQDDPFMTGGRCAWWDSGYVSDAWMLPEEDGWSLWYTGHRGTARNIGLAFRDGKDLDVSMPRQGVRQ